MSFLLRSIFLICIFLSATHSFSAFSHTIELDGDTINIILTATMPMGSGECPEPIIYWIANDDSLHLNVLHLWEGATGAAGCTRIDTVSIPPSSPWFSIPCKLIIEQSWIWGSSLSMHSIEEVDLCTVDVSEIMNESQIVIYPNPASDVVLITGISSVHQLAIFDAKGNLQFEDMIQTDHTQLDVHRWGKGLYLVCIIDQDGKKMSGPLIVE